VTKLLTLGRLGGHPGRGRRRRGRSGATVQAFGQEATEGQRRATDRLEAGAGHRADAAKSGATLDDMVAATGWLPHTTRAALTGLRKKGHELAKSKNADGQTVYRIEKAGAA